MVLALQLQDMDKAIEMLDQSTGLGERAFNLEHTAQFADVVLFLESDIHQVTGLRSACNCWQKRSFRTDLFDTCTIYISLYLGFGFDPFSQFPMVMACLQNILVNLQKKLIRLSAIFMWHSDGAMLGIYASVLLITAHIAKPRYVPFLWKCKTFSAGKG